jgi:uncharacterized protein
MDANQLADRLRGILNTPKPPAAPDPRAARSAIDSLERVLAGAWRDEPNGSCFVVERRVGAELRYGHSTVGDLADRLHEAAPEARLVDSVGEASPPLLFFDLETTGLSGGAGTQAFVVGCGVFDERQFVTRQYVLARSGDERPMLATVARELARACALVSFNGKAFDAPLLETRYLFHRLDWVGERLPHLDLLHLGRRFWGDNGEGCSLIALERRLFGVAREGDVAGFEIPGRYFHFVRTGDARPLAAVLEHNRLDLFSLAALTAKLLALVRCGHESASDAREALALGRVYRTAGLLARARAALAHAAGAAGNHPARIEALRLLALEFRRARQFDDAAACWRQLLEARECPGQLAREAMQALAIHHEHRLRDLAAARAFAVQSLDEGGGRERWNEAAQHRLARLDRKMRSSTKPGADGASLEF